MCFAYMYVCVPHICMVPVEVRKGNRSHGTGVKKWLQTTIQVQGTEPWSSVRATRDLNHGPISPALARVIHTSASCRDSAS